MASITNPFISPQISSKTRRFSHIHADSRARVGVGVGIPVRSSLQVELETERGEFRFDSVAEMELKEKGFMGLRKTKLVCTLGPSCSSDEELEKLAIGGMNVARLNMCHNTREWHRGVIGAIKRMNQEKGFCVAVMIDTEGSQVHMVGLGGDSSVKAEDGSIWLFTNEKFEGFQPFTVQVNYEGFSEGILPGDEVIVDGGMATFEVVEKLRNDLHCKCTDPGLLLPRAKLSFWRNRELIGRNIGLPTLSTKDTALTYSLCGSAQGFSDGISSRTRPVYRPHVDVVLIDAKLDWADIEFGISEGIDFIAVSFVKNAKDITNLKDYLATRSSKPIKVLAKIESVESFEKIDDIVEASDGVVVARGDLGVEIPLEEIPTMQEKITLICRQLNKPVIVASQLLESMIEYPTPTRAEVADVSEAVRQSADALMLSGESAVGAYADKALAVLCMASRRMELWSHEEIQRNPFPPHLAIALPDRVAEQICNTAVEMANKLGVDAIFVYTKHGHMASLLSRNRPNPPIFAFTENANTRMAMSLHWGIIPLELPLSPNMEDNIKQTFSHMKSRGIVNEGDVILVVSDLNYSSTVPSVFQSIQVRLVV